MDHVVAADPAFHASDVAFERALLLSRAGRFADAASAYEHAISLSLDTRETPIARSNLAEMEMLAGRLETAVTHYERALALAQDPRAQLLAKWGLAVALDRSDEHERALEHVRRAVEAEAGAMGVLRSDGVFFEPAHEVHYYEALGLEALAEKAGADRKRTLAVASAAWRAFLAGACQRGAFTDTARRNLERIERMLAAHERTETRARRHRTQRPRTTADTLP